LTLPCNELLGYWCFGGPCCLHYLHPADGGNVALRNTDNLPHHYMMS